MANSWLIVSGDQVGAQPIGDTSTTQKHPVGTIVKGRSLTYGEGEFIYLKGVGSTVAGSVVTYNTSSFTTTLAAAGAAISLNVAVAMSANVANQWGWYQISGVATVKKASATSLAAGAAVGASTGVVIAAATSNAIAGATVAAVASATSGTAAGFVTVMVNRPKMSET